MFSIKLRGLSIIQTAASNLLICLLLSLTQQVNGLIITSVIAGDKKFKTVSFDSKFLKPLTFEKDLPSTEFRRHRTLRPPKFDIDVNIPIKLPLEDEYPQEEYKKPVESNIFFQTGEINEPDYGGKKYSDRNSNKKRPVMYKDEYAAASNQQEQRDKSNDEGLSPSALVSEGIKGLLPALAKSIKFQPKFETVSNIQSAPMARRSNARSDVKDAKPITVAQQQQEQVQDLNQAGSYSRPQNQYAQQYSYNKEPDFVPGGFVNLQLSGPTGGPQMTYEDYDREKWAQQLSQTPGAMPYPILNYQQLQNFYGGLGTFTNGIAEHRYVENSLMDKFKSGLSQLTSKFHIG